MTGQGAPACRKEIWEIALTTRRVGKEGRGREKKVQRDEGDGGAG